MSTNQGNTMRTPSLQPVPEALPADHVSTPSNTNKKVRRCNSKLIMASLGSGQLFDVETRFDRPHRHLEYVWPHTHSLDTYDSNESNVGEVCGQTWRLILISVVLSCAFSIRRGWLLTMIASLIQRCFHSVPHQH